MKDVEAGSINISLEYGPCNCRTYDHIDPSEHREKLPENERQLVVPEAFDSKKAAAFRLREHNLASRKSAVHHRGIHVEAATINGERYEAL